MELRTLVLYSKMIYFGVGPPSLWRGSVWGEGNELNNTGVFMILPT